MVDPKGRGGGNTLKLELVFAMKSLNSRTSRLEQMTIDTLFMVQTGKMTPFLRKKYLTLQDWHDWVNFISFLVEVKHQTQKTDHLFFFCLAGQLCPVMLVYMLVLGSHKEPNASRSRNNTQLKDQEPQKSCHIPWCIPIIYSRYIWGYPLPQS